MLPPLAEHSLPGSTFGNSVLLQGNFRLLVLSKAEQEGEHAKVCALPLAQLEVEQGRRSLVTAEQVELPLHCKNYLLLYTHLTVILFFTNKNSSGAFLALALLPIPTQNIDPTLELRLATRCSLITPLTRVTGTEPLLLTKSSILCAKVTVTLGAHKIFDFVCAKLSRSESHSGTTFAERNCRNGVPVPGTKFRTPSHTKSSIL